MADFFIFCITETQSFQVRTWENLLINQQCFYFETHGWWQSNSQISPSFISVAANTCRRKYNFNFYEVSCRKLQKIIRSEDKYTKLQILWFCLKRFDKKYQFLLKGHFSLMCINALINFSSLHLSVIILKLIRNWSFLFFTPKEVHQAQAPVLFPK